MQHAAEYVVIDRRWHSITSRCEQPNASSQCFPSTSHTVHHQTTACWTGVCIRGRRCFRTRLWIVS